MSRTPSGKVGRLPAELRGQVNKMIRDNRPQAEILSFLAAHDEKDISPQNLSSWKGNGYVQWEKLQDRLDGMKLRREAALNLTEAAGAGGDGGLTLQSNAAGALAVDAIQEALEDFDTELLKELLAEKPERFVQIVDALASLRKGDQAFVALKMKFEDYRKKVAERMATLEALAGKKGQATPEDIRAIAKELYGV